MSKAIAELILVGLSIACGGGGWYLWAQGRRWWGLSVFFSGVVAMSAIVRHWHITVS